MERPITLFINNAITNDPCALCGTRTDPDGVDVGIGHALVCDRCADRQRPGLSAVGRSLSWLYDQEPAHMFLLKRLVAAANNAFDAIEAKVEAAGEEAKKIWPERERLLVELEVHCLTCGEEFIVHVSDPDAPVLCPKGHPNIPCVGPYSLHALLEKPE